MRTMDVLAQHHRVHDRQNARAAVIIALDVFIIREQARDRRRAFVKELRDVERQQRVELTRREHPLQRLPPGKEIEPKRKLGDLKLLVVEHALERLTRTQDLDGEVDALRLHAPVDQRPRAVVIPAGERELEIGNKDVSATDGESLDITHPRFKAWARVAVATERGRNAIRDRTASRTARSRARAPWAPRRHRASWRSNDCRR